MQVCVLPRKGVIANYKNMRRELFEYIIFKAETFTLAGKSIYAA